MTCRSSTSLRRLPVYQRSLDLYEGVETAFYNHRRALFRPGLINAHVLPTMRSDKLDLEWGGNTL